MKRPLYTPRDLATPLDRITWRDGQLLTSRDLNDDERSNDRLRHLHIRYLHRTWGVVEGLSVTILSGSVAIVSPGYALDGEGRELLLPKASRVPVPQGVSVATTMYLVISYDAAQPAHCGCVETPAVDLVTLCPGAENPVLLIEGALSFKTVHEVRYGRDVLLARLLVSNGRFIGEADMSVQRHAASMAQPRVWSDVTQAGQTGWTDASGAGFQSIQATVDTSDSGFLDTPAYFVRVTPASGLMTSFIALASAASFTLVARPISESAFSTRLAAVNDGFSAVAAEKAGLAIAWLAIELPSAGQREPL
jgi:hypothetical protein